MIPLIYLYLSLALNDFSSCEYSDIPLKKKTVTEHQVVVPQIDVKNTTRIENENKGETLHSIAVRLQVSILECKFYKRVSFEF